MVVLKKIKAATLIEVLTASVLIIIVFMMASLSFNNVFGNQIRNDHSAIENRIKELEYQYLHERIQLPYAEDFKGWEVLITKNETHVTFSYEKGGINEEKQHLIYT